MSRFKLSTFLAIPVFLVTTFGLAHTTSAATPTPSADRASAIETKMALRDLWVEHIFWIHNYVLAIHEGDQAQRKIANAHAIAKFLSGANPYLPEDTVFTLLAGHCGHHMAQITQIASGDSQDEATTWHAMRRDPVPRRMTPEAASTA